MQERMHRPLAAILPERRGGTGRKRAGAATRAPDIGPATRNWQVLLDSPSAAYLECGSTCSTLLDDQARVL